MIDPVDDLHARLDAIEPSVQPYSIEWSDDMQPLLRIERRPTLTQLFAAQAAMDAWASPEAQAAREAAEAARAADAALEARIARRVRIQAIEAEIATETDPAVLARLEQARAAAQLTAR